MKKRFLIFLSLQRSFCIAFLIFVLLGFILEIELSKEDIFLFINHHYNSFWDHFFLLYTWLGDGISVLIVALLMCFYKLRNALVTFLSYAYTSIVVQLMKLGIDAPRPLRYFEGKEHIRVIDGLSVHLYHSFPSGHSISALALATVLAYLIRNKKIGWAIFVAYILVAFSRVYLAEHFFLDIYVGTILGVLLTIQLICWLEGIKWFYSCKLDRRFFDKKFFEKLEEKRGLSITLKKLRLFEKH